MQNFILRPADEFIKLGQLLKAVGIAENGGEAKEMIVSGEVTVNGETEERRGRKLRAGDVVRCAGEEIKIEKPAEIE